MPLLSVGAGFSDSMIPDWLRGPMTGLNPPQRQRAPCQQSTQQGTAAGILDGGSGRPLHIHEQKYTIIYFVQKYLFLF